MSEFKKFLLGLICIISILLIIFSIVSTLSGYNKDLDEKKISALVNSYSSYIFASQNKKPEEQEQLKYTYFSNNNQNIATETIHRPKTVTIYDYALKMMVTHKKTNYMEVFHSDSELDATKINFAFPNGNIVLSSNFGVKDCTSFLEQIWKSHPELKLNVNNLNINDFNSISKTCDSQYNIVLVSLKIR